jgi:tetratricopeptide (TPR) repeat protein
MLVALQLTNTFCFGQKDSPHIIELKQQLSEHKKEDTGKVNILTDIAYQYNKVSPYDGIEYAQKALQLSEELGWQKGIIRSNSCIGANYFSLSDFSKAYKYWLVSLQVAEEIGFEQGVVNHLHNIGNVFFSQKNYPKALEYYERALKINEAAGNKTLITNAYTAIGNVYAQQKNYPLALQYHKKALLIDEELKNKGDIAADEINIGSVYLDMGEYAQAINKFKNALDTKKELGDKKAMTKAYSLLGKAFLLQDETKNDIEQHQSLLSAGYYLDTAINLATETNNLDLLQQTLATLSQVQERKGKEQEAFKTYKQYTIIKDSVFSLEKQADIFNLEKRAEIEAKLREVEREEEHHRQQQYIQIGGICTFIVLLIAIILLVRNKAINPRLIELLGTFSVLITFEFIQLLLHGKIGELTHHNLVWMLLCLMGVALIIVPLHHKIEHWLKKRLSKTHQIAKK